MKRSKPYLLIVLFGIFLIAQFSLAPGCSSKSGTDQTDGDSDGDTEQRLAGVGEPCNLESDCREDLTCVDNVCRLLADGDGSDSDGDLEYDTETDRVADGDTMLDGDTITDGDNSLDGDRDEDGDSPTDGDMDGSEDDRDLDGNENSENDVEDETDEQKTELICDDGIDDDKDGLTDCDDNDCDDRFEPNNVREEATSVNAQTYAENLVSRSGDPDWYVVAVCNGAIASIEIKSDVDVSQLGILLYNQNGTQVEEGKYIEGHLVASYGSFYVGVLYMYVFATQENSCISYTLDMVVDYNECLPAEICDNGEDDDQDLKIDCDDPDCNDLFEPNDSLATPYVASGTTASWNNLVISSGNTDYYKLSGCPGDNLHVILSYTESDGDVAIELVDAAGDMLAQGQVQSRTKSLTLDYTVTGLESALILHVTESNVDACQFYNLQYSGLSAECEPAR